MLTDDEFGCLARAGAFDWQRDPANGRYLCSPQYPMPAGRPRDERWSHTHVEEVGEQGYGYPGGDIVTYRCKDCGHTWRAELPQ
jgi:hypothetical protein